MGMNSAPKPSPTMAMFNFLSLMCTYLRAIFLGAQSRAMWAKLSPSAVPAVKGLAGIFINISPKDGLLGAVKERQDIAEPLGARKFKCAREHAAEPAPGW